MTWRVRRRFGGGCRKPGCLLAGIRVLRWRGCRAGLRRTFCDARRESLIEGDRFVRHYPGSRRWQALAVLGVAYLMVVLDVWIVNVALPSIQRNLHFSTSGLEWVVSGYALTFGGLLLLGGRSGDLLGRRRVVHSRARALRALLAPLRPLHLAWAADRHARAPGCGRGRSVPVGLLDRVGHLRGRLRAQHRARHPRRDRGVRSSDRPAVRWPGDGVRRLAVDLLRQHSDRPRRAAGGPEGRPRKPRARAGATTSTLPVRWP
jgi:hypothetical protein